VLTDTLDTLRANATVLEVTWSSVAMLGLLVAVAFEAAVVRSLVAVHAWINQGRARRWGPRHQFVLAFAVGIGLIVLVWLGFCALGLNAMLTPPALTSDREEAAERGGWILTLLEAVLFCFQVALFYAWVAVGGPSIKPHPVAKVRPS
jgi:hypothetical protein